MFEIGACGADQRQEGRDLVRKRYLRLGGSALGVVALTAISASIAGGTTRERSAPTATFKAGLVSDVGRFNDKGFNQNQLEGLKRAKRELRIETRAVESRVASDYIPNFASLARAKFNIIVGAGFL